MFISPLNMSPLSGGASSFTIAHSFLLDSINEKFVVPNADLAAYLSGTNIKFTTAFLLKRDSTGAEKTIFSSYATGESIIFRFLATATIQMLVKDGGSTLAIETTATFTSTTTWYHIAFSIDMETPANSKIIVNGVNQAVTNGLGNTINVPVSPYQLGTRAGALGLGAYVCYAGFVDYNISVAQALSVYNNGKPKSIQAVFGSNCVCFLNADNSGDTAQFTITDSVNGITATGSNMEDADKTTVTPY